MHRRSLLAALATMAGCGATPPPDSDGSVGTTTPVEPTPTISEESAFGLPGVNRNGNPTVTTPVNLRAVAPLDVDLPGTPVWLAGVPDAAGSLWAAVLDDGGVVGVRLAENRSSTFELARNGVEGAPLLVTDEDNGDAKAGRIVEPSTLAAHTHPVPVAGGLAWVRRDGRLRTPGGVVAVDALPDAVPVSDGPRVFVLTEPTDSYEHAVLGDGIEARSLAVVDATSGTIERRLQPPDGTVIEGRSAMVTTLGGDQAAVITASDGADGARLVAFGADGNWRAIGPPIGAGFRWRHQLAVAPFAPDGERVVAAVKTPHIGGVAEFYRREGDRLRLATTDDGNYQSHEIGSRNLGGAVGGRFTGDGRWVLLLPDRLRTSLVGLAWTGGGSDPTVERVFSLSLDAPLTTNVAAIDGNAGTGEAVVAAGTDSGLRFWRRRPG